MSGPGRGNWTTKHGGAKRSGRAPEYNSWAKMLDRCRNPKSPDYKNYGGRGINVCDAWADFAKFLEDMGPRPSPGHSIERVNNDEGYSPSNCVWATREVQARNRRPRALKEFCQRGHSLTGDNVYVRASGKRGCKQCRRLNMLDYYARQNAEAAHG